MAFNFSNRNDDDQKEPAVPSYVSTPTPNTPPVTVIAKGVRIEGDFGGDGDMRIDGEVAGKLTVGGTLTIGPDAKIKAEVKAGSLVISGSIEGNVVVDSRLDLKATANLKGDIRAQTLTVESGATIHGSVEVDRQPVSGSPSASLTSQKAVEQESSLTTGKEINDTDEKDEEKEEDTTEENV